MAEVKETTIDQLIPDDRNMNKGTEKGKKLLDKSITQFGAGRSILLDKNNRIIAGNKTALIDYMHEMKSHYADTIIWDKESSQPAMGKNVLNSEFEYVHIFSEKATRAIGVREFRGTLSNMLHLSNRIGRDKEIQKIHSATFPLDFAAHFINNFTNDSVLDLFGGAGTTLIAAEQLGRKCYTMELDPRYCDVILARWEKLTGKTAERI